MYIYLDESYNLKDREKKQFISINGFKTTDVKQIRKHWKIYRRRFISKNRIHATDGKFEPLRKNCLNLIYSLPDAYLITSFQSIQEIPTDKASFYYKKDKLDFEKVYEDLVKALLDKLNLQEYKKVIITIDSRKHKGGILKEKRFRENILFYLKECYPNTIFNFEIQPSYSNVLLEIADFVSNTFYKKYTDREIKSLEELKIKTIQIKNPLGKPRG